MNPFEYAMGLISIVIGLALGDMATSFHKLVRHRRTIVWDARVLIAAALIFVLLFSMWYELWGIRNRPEVLSWLFLLSLIVELVLAFLAASSVLPDDPSPGFDLGAFYGENARSLWAIYAIFLVSYLGHWLYFKVTFGRTAIEILELMPLRFLPLAITLALLRWPRQRLLHLVLLSALLLLRVSPYLADRISL